jgi:hypothetical protein
MGKRQTKKNRTDETERGRSLRDHRLAYAWNPFPNVNDEKYWNPIPPPPSHGVDDELDRLLQQLRDQRSRLLRLRKDRSLRPPKRSASRMQGNR